MRDAPWLEPRLWPASNCSSRTTSRPRRANHHAAAEPIAPAPTTTTSGIRRHYALVVVVAAALVLLVPPPAADARAVPNYVALGDSYTAGPLIPAPIAPFGCIKSD